MPLEQAPESFLKAYHQNYAADLGGLDFDSFAKNLMAKADDDVLENMATYMYEDKYSEMPRSEYDERTGMELWRDRNPGWVKNTALGLGEFMLRFTGGLATTVDTLGDYMEQVAPLGGFGIKEDGTFGYIPGGKYSTDEEWLDKAAKSLNETKLGYIPNELTWDEVKDKPVREVMGFAFEHGIISLPAMLMMMSPVTAPVWVLGHSGMIADERARNEFIDDPTMREWGIGLGSAGFSAFLDRVGARGIFGLSDAAFEPAIKKALQEQTKKAFGESLKQVTKATGRAGLMESVTEAIQETNEYLAATVGTERGTDMSEALHAGVSGAVVGGIFGGALRTGTASLQASAVVRREKLREQVEKETQEAEKSGLDEDTDQEDEEEQAPETGYRVYEASPVTEMKNGDIAVLTPKDGKGEKKYGVVTMSEAAYTIYGFDGRTSSWESPDWDGIVPFDADLIEDNGIPYTISVYDIDGVRRNINQFDQWQDAATAALTEGEMMAGQTVEEEPEIIPPDGMTEEEPASPGGRYQPPESGGRPAPPPGTPPEGRRKTRIGPNKPSIGPSKPGVGGGTTAGVRTPRPTHTRWPQEPQSVTTLKLEEEIRLGKRKELFPPDLVPGERVTVHTVLDNGSGKTETGTVEEIEGSTLVNVVNEDGEVIAVFDPEETDTGKTRIFTPLRDEATTEAEDEFELYKKEVERVLSRKPTPAVVDRAKALVKDEKFNQLDDETKNRLEDLIDKGSETDEGENTGGPREPTGGGGKPGGKGKGKGKGKGGKPGSGEQTDTGDTTDEETETEPETEPEGETTTEPTGEEETETDTETETGEDQDVEPEPETVEEPFETEEGFLQTFEEPKWDAKKLRRPWAGVAKPNKAGTKIVYDRKPSKFKAIRGKGGTITLRAPAGAVIARGQQKVEDKSQDISHFRITETGEREGIPPESALASVLKTTYIEPTKGQLTKLHALIEKSEYKDADSAYRDLIGEPDFPEIGLAKVEVANLIVELQQIITDIETGIGPPPPPRLSETDPAGQIDEETLAYIITVENAVQDTSGARPDDATMKKVTHAVNKIKFILTTTEFDLMPSDVKGVFTGTLNSYDKWLRRIRRKEGQIITDVGEKIKGARKDEEKVITDIINDAELSDRQKFFEYIRKMNSNASIAKLKKPDKLGERVFNFVRSSLVGSKKVPAAMKFDEWMFVDFEFDGVSNSTYRDVSEANIPEWMKQMIYLFGQDTVPNLKKYKKHHYRMKRIMEDDVAYMHFDNKSIGPYKHGATPEQILRDLSSMGKDYAEHYTRVIEFANETMKLAVNKSEIEGIIFMREELAKNFGILTETKTTRYKYSDWFAVEGNKKKIFDMYPALEQYLFSERRGRDFWESRFGATEDMDETAKKVRFAKPFPEVKQEKPLDEKYKKIFLSHRERFENFDDLFWRIMFEWIDPLNTRRSALRIKDIFRTGEPDWREGRDIESEWPVKDMKARAMEWGNWTKAIAQDAMNLFYDSWHDLAHVLPSIRDIKDVSFTGRLAFSFGSRGRGGRHLARYFPGKELLDFTRDKSDGSLAHEWSHALDYHMQDSIGSGPNELILSKKKMIDGIEELKNRLKQYYGYKGFMEDLRARQRAYERDGSVRKKAFRLYMLKKLKDEIDDRVRWEDTDFYENSKLHDGAAKPYWSKDEELFARAHEQYVAYKLKDAGIDNRFLAGHHLLHQDDAFLSVYPTGEERDFFFEMFDKMHEEMQWIGKYEIAGETYWEEVIADKIENFDEDWFVRKGLLAIDAEESEIEFFKENWKEELEESGALLGVYPLWITDESTFPNFTPASKPNHVSKEIALKRWKEVYEAAEKDYAKIYKTRKIKKFLATDVDYLQIKKDHIEVIAKRIEEDTKDLSDADTEQYLMNYIRQEFSDERIDEHIPYIKDVSIIATDYLRDALKQRMPIPPSPINRFDLTFLNHIMGAKKAEPGSLTSKERENLAQPDIEEMKHITAYVLGARNMVFDYAYLQLQSTRSVSLLDAMIEIREQMGWLMQVEENYGLPIDKEGKKKTHLNSISSWSAHPPEPYGKIRGNLSSMKGLDLRIKEEEQHLKTHLSKLDKRTLRWNVFFEGKPGRNIDPDRLPYVRGLPVDVFNQLYEYRWRALTGDRDKGKTQAGPFDEQSEFDEEKLITEINLENADFSHLKRWFFPDEPSVMEDRMTDEELEDLQVRTGGGTQEVIRHRSHPEVASLYEALREKMVEYDELFQKGEMPEDLSRAMRLIMFFHNVEQEIRKRQKALGIESMLNEAGLGIETTGWSSDLDESGHLVENQWTVYSLTNDMDINGRNAIGRAILRAGLKLQNSDWIAWTSGVRENNRFTPDGKKGKRSAIVFNRFFEHQLLPFLVENNIAQVPQRPAPEIDETEMMEAFNPDSAPKVDVDKLISNEAKKLYFNENSLKKAGENVIKRQADAAARILHQYDNDGKAFILSLPPASGKTYIMSLAMREMIQRGENNILFVADKRETLLQNLEDFTVNGILKPDQLNVVIPGKYEKATGGELAPIQMTTQSYLADITVPYEKEFDRLTTANPNRTGVLFIDESQAGIGQSSKMHQTMRRAAYARKFTVYASGTAFKSHADALFLHETGIFDDYGGVREFFSNFNVRATPKKAHVTSRARIVDASRFMHFLTEKGHYWFYDLELPEGMVTEDIIDVPIPEKEERLYRQVELMISEIIADPVSRDSFQQWNLQRPNELKRLTEAGKVKASFKKIDEALAKGWKVLAFTPTKDERVIGEFKHPEKYMKAFPETRKDRYSAQEVITEYEKWMASLSDDSDSSARETHQPFSDPAYDLALRMVKYNMQPAVRESVLKMYRERYGDKVRFFTGSERKAVLDKNKADWDAGKIDLMVATVSKGGRGISFHDEIGAKKGTLMTLIGLEWDPAQFAQVMGRTARLGMQSPVEIAVFVSHQFGADAKVESTLRRRLARMGAVTAGKPDKTSQEFTERGQKLMEGKESKKKDAEPETSTVKDVPKTAEERVDIYRKQSESLIDMVGSGKPLFDDFVSGDLRKDVFTLARRMSKANVAVTTGPTVGGVFPGRDTTRGLAVTASQWKGSSYVGYLRRAKHEGRADYIYDDPTKPIIIAATGGEDPLRTISHETIHALSFMGLLTLEDRAMLKAHVWGHGLFDEFDIQSRYGGESEEKQYEEAIAELFAYWAIGGGGKKLGLQARGEGGSRKEYYPASDEMVEIIETSLEEAKESLEKGWREWEDFRAKVKESGYLKAAIHDDPNLKLTWERKVTAAVRGILEKIFRFFAEVRRLLLNRGNEYRVDALDEAVKNRVRMSERQRKDRTKWKDAMKDQKIGILESDVRFNEARLKYYSEQRDINDVAREIERLFQDIYSGKYRDKEGKWEYIPEEDKADFQEDDAEIGVMEDRVTFSDPNTESQFQEALKGTQSKTVGERLKNHLLPSWRMITRHRVHIDQGKETGAHNADLIEKMRHLEHQRRNSVDDVSQYFHKVIGDLPNEDFELITRAVILPDLVWTASQGMELPWGLNKDTVIEEAKKVTDALEARPELEERVAYRREYIQEVKDEMVSVGVLTPEQARNPDYYRHQVLEYAEMKNQYGQTRKVVNPYWHRRKGSDKSINANFLEAEADWLFKAKEGIATKRFLKWLEDSKYNSMKEYRHRAKTKNNTGIYDAVAAEYLAWADNAEVSLPASLREKLQNSEMKESDKNANSLISSLIKIDKVMDFGGQEKKPILLYYAESRQRMASYMRRLKRALDNIDADAWTQANVPDKIYRAVESITLASEIDAAMKAARSRVQGAMTEEEVEAFAESAADDYGELLDDQLMQGMIFDVIGWLTKQKEEIFEQPKRMALGVLGTISRRRKFIKEQVLKDEYVNPLNSSALIAAFGTESKVAWQPDSYDGKTRAIHIFVEKTIPEHAYDRLLDTIADMKGDEFGDAVTPEQLEAIVESIRDKPVLGPPKHEMIVDDYVSASLNEFRDEFSERMLGRMIAKGTRLWKMWILFNFRRFPKYMLNNMVGDMESILVNPTSWGTLKYVPQAFGEIRNYLYHSGEPTWKLQLAHDRGVLDSALTAQEIMAHETYDLETYGDTAFERRPKANKLSKAAKKYFDTVRNFALWRENAFRYAAFLHYYDQVVDQGKGVKEIGYGAVPKHILDGITDPIDLAARYATDALGNYGNLSHLGRKLRRGPMPFWSWCTPSDTEIFTREGWRTYEQIKVGDDVLTWNKETDRTEWQPIKKLAKFDYDAELDVFENQHVKFRWTPDHRVPVKENQHTVKRPSGTYHYDEKRYIVRSYELNSHHRIPLVAPHEFNEEEPILSPYDAEMLGWIVTDGYSRWRGESFEGVIYQSPKKHADYIRDTFSDSITSESIHPDTGVICFRLSADSTRKIKEVFKSKQDMTSIVTRLCRKGAERMYDAMVKAEAADMPENHMTCFTQKRDDVMDAFQMLAYINGKAGNVKKCDHWRGGQVNRMYVKRHTTLSPTKCKRYKEHYKGYVWCPVTDNSTWVMRQNGATMITGNTESNFVRYSNLYRNIYYTSREVSLEKGIAQGAALAGVHSLAILGVWSLYHWFNNLWFPEDEELLSIEERMRPHILLGENGYGEVRMVRFQGAISDYFGWFGLGDAAQSLLEIDQGFATYGDVMAEIAKAPINKLIGGINPFYKTPLEVATGKSSFPDLFRPVDIRDWKLHMSKALSMDNEYAYIARNLFGQPVAQKPYLNTIPGVLVSYKKAEDIAKTTIRGKAYRQREDISKEKRYLMHQLRRSLILGDAEGTALAMSELAQLGVSDRSIRQAGRSLHPLAALSNKEKKEFMQKLSRRERMLLQMAIMQYNEYLTQLPPLQGARRGGLSLGLDLGLRL